jgi:hypothetical protein
MSSLDRREELAASVITGADGWLFYRDHNVLESLSSQYAFSEAELGRWRYTIETRHAWMQERGIHYSFLIVPGKHVVYRDKLPPDIEVTEGRPAAQLLRSLSKHSPAIPMLYPLEELTAQRERHETYFKTDSHWNMLGGYLGYRAVTRAMQAAKPFRMIEFNDLKLHSRPLCGDLAVRLDEEPSYNELYYSIQGDPPENIVYRNKMLDRGNTIVWQNPNRALPRLVVFRDSFCNWMLPLFAQTFSRIVAVSTMQVLYDLLEAEQPDFVLTEICERFLNVREPPDNRLQFVGDITGPSFAELTGTDPRSLPGI